MKPRLPVPRATLWPVTSHSGYSYPAIIALWAAVGCQLSDISRQLLADKSAMIGSVQAKPETQAAKLLTADN